MPPGKKFTAEQIIGKLREAYGIPDPPQAGRIRYVHQLVAEPTFKIVGHRFHPGDRDRRHRGHAGHFGPQPGLGLEIGPGQLQQAGPRGQAKIIAAEPPAAVSISIRIVRGTKRAVPGVAGTQM